MTESMTFPDSLTVHFTDDRFSTLCGQAILTDTPVVFRHLHPSGYAPTYLCDACDEKHRMALGWKPPTSMSFDKTTGKVVYRYEDDENILLEYDEA